MDRLYLNDAYLTEFMAEVLESSPCEDGRCKVRLDQTAFYPTSGGQPYDTGTLGDALVSDVFMKGQDVWHVVDKSLEVGEKVVGKIDWARRFDHMQQHAGEHMLAGEIHRRLKGYTIGLHCGAEISTIDVELPDGRTRVDAGVLEEIELAVNEQIQRDVPIRSWFPDDVELKELPLRKPPSVDEGIRVVAIGDWEYCACGGTHPSSSGQIGLFKITDVRPSKGKMRVSFLCGMRAYKDYQLRMRTGNAAAEILSDSVYNLPELVAQMKERLKQQDGELVRYQNEAMQTLAKRLSAENQRKFGECKLIISIQEIDNMDVLVALAKALVESPATIALLSGNGSEKDLLLFARSADAGVDMGKLLRDSVRVHGGKGGGRLDFAQGSAPDGQLVLNTALEILDSK